MQDFDTIEAYNDYLEEVEDIIYNIVNNLDTEMTKRRISDYKQKNAQNITYNMIKKSVNVNIQQNLQDANNSDMKNPSKPIQAIPTESKIDNVKRQPTMILNNPIQEKNLSPEELEKLIQTRSKAGGYNPEWPMKRAFEEAFNTLK